VVASNDDQLTPSNRIQCVNVNSDIDSDSFAGYLNSTIHATLLEFWGRNEGGGSLEIMTYELEDIPVVDFNKLPEDQRFEIASAYRALAKGEDNAQTRLDRAVLNAIGSDIEAEKLQKMHEAVMQSRVQGAKETNVLVAELDEFDEIGTRSFRRGDEDNDLDDGGNSSLDDF